MPLQAVVFKQDLLGYNTKDLYSLVGGSWSYEDNHFRNQNKNDLVNTDYWLSSPSPNPMAPPLDGGGSASCMVDISLADTTRPKRRRLKTRKIKEEIENQRMTHIAVERNRRRQMNEYLSVLRSIMPESYVQRGDQASITGGAINFVKELEHCVQLLSAKKEVKERPDGRIQEDAMLN